MLRFLTAGESHGKGLVAILEGIPAALRLILTRSPRSFAAARAATVATAHGDRVRSRGAAQRCSARGNDRCAHRALHPNKDWEKLATDDVRRAGTTAGRLRRRSASRHPSTSGACRPGRCGEVRARRHPGRARTCERPRNRRASGGRLHRPTAPPSTGTDIVTHVISIGSVAVADPLALTYADVQQIRPDAPLNCAIRKSSSA